MLAYEEKNAFISLKYAKEKFYGNFVYYLKYWVKTIQIR